MKTDIKILILITSLIFSQVSFATSSSSDVDNTEHWLQKQSSSFDKSAVLTVNQFLLENAASRITTCKKVTASSMVFATSGILGLTAEVGNAHGFKDSLDTKLESFITNENKGTNQEQGLNTLLEGYNDKINSIEKRLEYMKATETTQHLGAAVSYLEGLKGTVAKAKSTAGAQACIAGAPNEIAVNPASALACQQCLQRSLSSNSQIQANPADLTDGIRGLVGASNIFKDRDIKAPNQNTYIKNHELNKPIGPYVNNESTFDVKMSLMKPIFPLGHFLLKFISSKGMAQSDLSCGSTSGCSSCPSIERDINDYYKSRIEALNVCDGGLQLTQAIDNLDDDVTGFGTSGLMEELGLGNTLKRVAVESASPVGTLVDAWVSKPYNRALMIEASAALSATNISQVSKNLETAKKNRDYVVNLIDKVRTTNSFVVGKNRGAVRSNRKTVANNILKSHSTETARASLDFSDTKKAVAEVKGLLKKYKVLCAGGRRNGECQSPELSERLDLQGLSHFERAEELSESLDIVSKISVTSSNGKINEALKYVRALNDPRRVALIKNALREIKERVNDELYQSNQETINFEIGRNLFLESLENKVINKLRHLPGDSKSLVEKNEFSRSNHPEKIANKIREVSPSRSISSIEDVQPDSIENKRPAIKEKHLAHSQTESILNGRDLNVGDIIQDPTIPLFEAISYRYSMSARPVFSQRQTKKNK